MAHGLPDEALIKGLGLDYASQDLGELATRLGSPLTVHRSGSVFWLTDFRAGVGTAARSGSGGYSGCALASTRTAFGGCSLRLLADTGATDYAQAIWRWPNVGLPTIGIALLLSINLETPLQDIVVRDLRLGVSRTYGIRYNWATKALYVYEDPVTWTLTGETPDLSGQDTLFHHIKLLLDLDRQTYGDLFLNSESYDLRGYTPDDTALPGRDNTSVTLKLWGGQAAQVLSYLDALIITRDEVV